MLLTQIALLYLRPQNIFDIYRLFFFETYERQRWWNFECNSYMGEFKYKKLGSTTNFTDC